MNKIFELGIKDDCQPYQKEIIKLSNKVAFLFALFGVLYSIFSILYAPKSIVIPLIMFVGSLSALGFNYYFLSNFSRFFLTVVITISVGLYNTLPVAQGEELMHHFYLGQFAITLIPWIIIDIRETPLLITSLLFSYLVFISLPWLNNHLYMNFDNEWLQGRFMTYAVYLSAIVAAVFCLLFLQSRLIKRDNMSKKISRDIELKISEMQSRQKELQKRIDEINESYKEEENRSWIASGISKMTNLMRQTKSDKIFPDLIEAITKYMDVAQGAIYMVKEDDHNQGKYLELEGVYAFDRRKFINKKVSFGDGLLGQSCIEQEIIKINNVPDTFPEIITGLGDAPPKNLIIVPLIYDEKVMGVLEMLAYKPFTDYETEFLKQLGENIASFISNNLINIRTKELLEQSQQQAEEMRAQEEEMRQNMEELQATQEEMARKEKEYLKKIEELEAQLNSKDQKVHVDG